MRIGILGLGGVGTLIASNLLREGHQVYCFGSINSNNHIKEKGIILKSSFYGNSHYFPKFKLAENQFIDYLFITVKGNYLLEALKDYEKFFNKNTVGILLLNGLGHKELIKANFDLKLIIGTIGSVEVFLDENRIAIHKSSCKPYIEIASSNREMKNNVYYLKRILENSQINCSIFVNDNLVIWRKLIRLSIISIITSLSQANLGFSLQYDVTKNLISPLLQEFCAITSELNLNFEPNKILEKINELPCDLMTSMQRDIALGKETEIDFLIGEPLKLGKSLGINLPVLEKCYLNLRNLIREKSNE